MAKRTFIESETVKKVVLFDIDGTIIDSWDFIYGAFKYTVDFHGLKHPTEEFMKSTIGKSLSDFYQAAFPMEDHILLGQTHHNFQQARFDSVKLFPNIVSTLKKIKETGFQIAAVSNRSKDSLHKSLKLAKIHKFFDIIVSADDVKNPKPHKDHLMKALKYFKIKSSDAFMVGDTDYDIKAGKHANVSTIGVTYGFAGKDIKNYNPDFVINALDEVLDILK